VIQRITFGMIIRRSTAIIPPSGSYDLAADRDHGTNLGDALWVNRSTFCPQGNRLLHQLSVAVSHLHLPK
jgi:hypothetical protein